MLKNCENCGGKIEFSPKDKGNKCENCGSVFPIEYKYEFSKKVFDQNVGMPEDNFAKELKSIKCKSCGANVLLGKYEMQSTCPYCGNSNIYESKKKNIMSIDSIIPFAFNKTEAVSKLKTAIRKSFFANKSIFRRVIEKNVVGEYINAFVFDMNTTTKFKGVLAYSETVRDKDGRSKTITKHRYVDDFIVKDFKNIAVEANSNLNQTEFSEILPFEYASCVNFQPDFMNGYMLEYHDRMFKDAVAIAEKIMKSGIEREILNKYRCDSIVELQLNTNYQDKKYNYCLLPVYFVNKEVKGKKYRALINGQTGKVSGLPFNKWKIFLIILLTCGALVAFVLFILFAF